MTRMVKSILFVLLSSLILPAYAYHDHHRYHWDGRGYHWHHHHHHYCHQHRQWVSGHWEYRPKFHDKVWIPGHWVWVRWCR